MIGTPSGSIPLTKQIGFVGVEGVGDFVNSFGILSVVLNPLRIGV
jgi:hypothetical protein